MTLLVPTRVDDNRPTEALRPIPAGQRWTKVFEDDFDGPTLDTTKWYPYLTFDYFLDPPAGSIHGGTTEQAWAPIHQDAGGVWVGDNLSFANSALSITAKKETVAGRLGDGTPHTYDYTTGVIVTQGKFSFEYGYLEGRMKLPWGDGFQSTFWTLVDPSGWPPEIDVVESLGESSTVAFQTVHYDPGAAQYQVVTSQVGSLAFNYHTFGVDWRPDTLDFYVDGLRVNAATNADFPGVAPNSGPMYIIVKLGVGGSWPTPPNAFTPWPSSMVVDWVRVWQYS